MIQNAAHRGIADPGHRAAFAGYCEYDCKCEPFSSILGPWTLRRRPCRCRPRAGLCRALRRCPPGTSGRVVGVGAARRQLSALERRLLEFGFVQRRARRDSGRGTPRARSLRGARRSHDARPATSRGAERLGGTAPARVRSVSASAASAQRHERPAAAALAAPSSVSRSSACPTAARPHSSIVSPAAARKSPTTRASRSSARKGRLVGAAHRPHLPRGRSARRLQSRAGHAR